MHDGARLRLSELIDDGDPDTAKFAHSSKLLWRFFQWDGLADQGGRVQFAGDDQRQHVIVATRLHPVASIELKLPSDDLVHGNARQMVVPGEQADLDMTSSFAQTENRVGTRHCTAKGIYRHVRPAAGDLANGTQWLS
jgi:hypothetical protein